MNTRSKLAGIAVAAAAALGAFGILGAGESTPAFAAPAIVVAAAQPADTAPAAKAAADKPAVDCSKQAWPYVPRECLAAATGTPVRNVTRTITANAR